MGALRPRVATQPADRHSCLPDNVSSMRCASTEPNPHPSASIPTCSLLEEMQADVQAGKFAYKAPWAGQHPQQQQQQDVTSGTGSGGGGGNRTGHSVASSLGAAFLTPGGLDERRSNATPTVVSGWAMLK